MVFITLCKAVWEEIKKGAKSYYRLQKWGRRLFRQIFLWIIVFDASSSFIRYDDFYPEAQKTCESIRNFDPEKS